MPALNETQIGSINGSASTKRRSPGKNKFYFGTRQASESVGEKEDPRQARRLKLSQVVLNNDAYNQNDSKLANMIYGTQVNTSKNLVAVRSIRHSLKDSAFLDDKITVPITSSNLPSIN